MSGFLNDSKLRSLGWVPKKIFDQEVAYIAISISVINYLSSCLCLRHLGLGLRLRLSLILRLGLLRMCRVGCVTAAVILDQI